MIQPYLVDKSAYVTATRDQAAAEALTAIIDAGLCGWTEPVAGEVLYSARNLAEYQRIRADFAELPRLQLTSAAADRTLTVLDALARRGQHRAPSQQDLLIAAVAEEHGTSVVHCDKDYELIAEVTGQPVEWLVRGL